MSLPVPLKFAYHGHDAVLACAATTGIIMFCTACTGVSEFDASLFRISGAEAVAMDSQQRLLLEISHEVICTANPPGSKAKARSPELCVAGVRYYGLSFVC